MKLDDDLIPLLNKAYHFLKFRPRTEKEMRDYLYKKVSTTHWSRDSAEKIIEKLKGMDLVDDGKFIEWFVRSRTALKPKGQKLLARELQMKGVNKELIDGFFSDNSVDEEKLAFQILEKRFNRFKSLDQKKRFEKSVRFLMSRGFSYDLSKRTFDKLNG